MDQLDVKEVCSISGETFSSSSEDDDESLITQRRVDHQKTVQFEDGKQKKKKLKRTKRELRAEHAARYERDRMSMVMPDPVRDRERERNFVHLATKGVVQLFNAVAERQKELSDVSAANMTSKKRRLRGISAESFRRKLAESRIVKDGVDDTKDWLSDDQVAIKSETEDDLNTSEIKTEVESNSE
ncbi:Rrp15p family protein [Acanthocheilonema viteae]